MQSHVHSVALEWWPGLRALKVGLSKVFFFGADVQGIVSEMVFLWCARGLKEHEGEGRHVPDDLQEVLAFRIQKETPLEGVVLMMTLSVVL